MIKKYLECGEIVSTHGVRGELKVKPWTDTPDYLCAFSTLYLQKGERALAVEGCRVNKNMVLLKVSGIDSLESAVTLRGKILYIDREDAPEDEGTFIQDLLGLQVYDAGTGRDYGKVKDIVPTGANDVYILEDGGKQRLVPAIPDVIVRTDLSEGKMYIRPLEGLFDDED